MKRVDHALVVAGWIAIVGIVWHNMAIVGDGFWAIATGRWMLAHRAIPRTDPFSFSSVTDSLVVVSSGLCLAFGWVERHAGLRALMILCTGVESAAASILWLATARTSVARLLLVPLALLFVRVDAADLSARGQIFGDLFFVLLLLMLAKLRDGRRVHPAVVVAVACLWTNLHVSFLLAIFVPLAAAALLAWEPRETRPPVSRFFAASALAIVGSFLNPYGPMYLVRALKLAFDPSAADFDLFQSPDFHDLFPLLAIVVGVLAITARDRLGSARLRRPDQAFVLAFLIAACLSRRYTTELVAVSIGVLGPILDQEAPVRPLPFRPVLIAIASGLLALPGLAWIRSGNDPLGDVPVAAARVSRDHAASIGDDVPFHRVVNPLHWGGYLAYAWMGEPRYFVDGRDQAVLFGNGVNDDARVLWTGAAGWSEILDAYEAGVVLWERGNPLDGLLRRDPGWRLVHEDAMAVVYERLRQGRALAPAGTTLGL